MPTRALILILLAALLAPSPAAIGASPDDQEIRLGREYARRIEVQYKVIASAVGERVARVGAEVAAAAERPELPYTFKVLDVETMNAISLPGGFIYITKGMLSFVRSDHELAAVLAHEAVHAAHRHQLEMIRRNNQATFWTLLIALLTRDSNIAQGASLISTSILSGYTRELERDADLTGIAYLVKTPYTPVAMLTIMERLRREEQYRPEADPGIFADHPRTEERVAYVEAELRRRGIPLVRRPAMNYLRIATRTPTEQGRQIGELLVDETVVLRLPDPARVQAIADRLDRFFNTDPQPFEIAARQVSGTWWVYGGASPLMTVAPSDAAFGGLSVADAALQIVSKLRWVIEQDLRQRRLSG